MNPLAGNLEALLARHPVLAEPLRADPSEELVVISTPSGLPSALWQGTHIHSGMDPRREAERLITREAGSETTLALFLGFGLGYLVEEFHRLHPRTPMVVVEPEAGLFRKALEARDLRQLLASPRILWSIGEPPERLVMRLEEESLPLAACQIMRLRALSFHHEAFYRSLEALLRIHLDRREVNLNTLKRFGRLWVRNLLKNLEAFIAAPGVDALKGKLAGAPALILAAGPSLEEVLPLLGALRERMLLVAVDTSLSLCLGAGVEPDLLVTVDPQYWNTRYLDRAGKAAPIVVSESSAHPRTFRLLQGPERRLFFISSFFPLGRFLEGIIGVKGQVGAGGSVATTAWDVARLLGCDPILLAGLDLGFPDRRTHCRGAFFEEAMHHQSLRTAPAEGAGFRYLLQAAPFNLPSNSGSPVLTDRRMIIYKQWFENQMRIMAGREGAAAPRSFSLSARGLRIEGMPYRPLEELEELPPARERIDGILKEACSIRIPTEELATSRGRVREAFRALEVDLKRLENLAAEGLALCGDRGRQRDPKRLFRELDVIDRKILGLSSRQVAAFLMEDLIQRTVASGGGGKTLPEVLESSRLLYLELGEAAHYHLGLLRSLANPFKENY